MLLLKSLVLSDHNKYNKIFLQWSREKWNANFSFSVFILFWDTADKNQMGSLMVRKPLLPFASVFQNECDVGGE